MKKQKKLKSKDMEIMISNYNERIEEFQNILNDLLEDKIYIKITICQRKENIEYDIDSSKRVVEFFNSLKQDYTKKRDQYVEELNHSIKSVELIKK